ncbi:MAG: EAL domain-containing protein, partial [Lachnospiraceae bacterium]|nr:EAL domain-containing protein [Lachnospiraceae bacterium]
DFVTKIKEAGIKTSIDDFGSGYSSLNMLKDLDADIIKLDKTFLDHLLKKDSKQDEIVIKNVVNMINELDMEAIAEGVETKEQADFLRGVKCKMAQGFLYDRPLPHDEFEQRLVSGRSYQI